LRRAMGLLILWSTIFGWLNPAKTEVIDIKTEAPNFGRKHKEIPILENYEKERKFLGSVSVMLSRKCNKKCKYPRSKKTCAKMLVRLYFTAKKSSKKGPALA